jgi:hypothetical protein
MEIISFRKLFQHGEVDISSWFNFTGIDFYADIDLTSMIPTLDNTASEIVQYQRDSTVQRKDLAQKTKDFRKLEDSAKLGEIKGLLKGWWHAEHLMGTSKLTHCYSIPNLHRPTYEPL